MAKTKKLKLLSCGAVVLEEKATKASRERMRKLGAHKVESRGSVETWSMGCKR